jgi:hypothetical protein
VIGHALGRACNWSRFFLDELSRRAPSPLVPHRPPPLDLRPCPPPTAEAVSPPPTAGSQPLPSSDHLYILKKFARVPPPSPPATVPNPKTLTQLGGVITAPINPPPRTVVPPSRRHPSDLDTMKRNEEEILVGWARPRRIAH